MDVSTSAPSVRVRPDRAALLDVEPDFAAGIPTPDLDVARRVIELPRTRLAPGPWHPADDARAGALLGFLVLEGVVAHEVLVADGRSMRLLGRGDVVETFDCPDLGPPAVQGWLVLEETVVLALDRRFIAATRRWPGLLVALHRRFAAQASRAALHTAIAELGRVEQRVLAMLWHLVDRWGAMTPEGIVIKVRLTHEMLGRLVGARRPTITLALGSLATSGDVRRRADGLLVLSPGSRELLRPPPGP
jgi:CRP/FNR family transcriptional regulator, cyclic AMP receptor protein